MAGDWEVRSVIKINHRHSYTLCHKMSSSVVLQPTVSLCFMNDDKKHQLKQVIFRPHRYTQWDSQLYVTFGSPVYLVLFIVRVTLERKCICLYILGVL